jgi:hypothetical protein
MQFKVFVFLLLTTKSHSIIHHRIGDMAEGFGPLELGQDELQAKLSAMDSVPLFMKSLPEDDSENPMIAALQDLTYEGTPDGG